MPPAELWCTTHEVPHPPEGWQPDCTPSAEAHVGALAEVIAEAHENGIRAGAWSLARWIIERWPARVEQATVPEALRLGTVTSRQVVDDIMALVDPLNPPPDVRTRIVRKVLFTYGAGMVGGRAGRQPEVQALQAALARRHAPREDPS